MTKTELVHVAIDATSTYLKALAKYGAASPEVRAAQATTQLCLDLAERAGATKDDFEAAKKARAAAKETSR